MQSELNTKPAPRRNNRVVLGIFVISMQLVMIAIAFMIGFIVRDWAYGDNPITFFQNKSKLALVEEAYNLLNDNAYFPLPAGQSLQYGMIKGMVQTYNEPYTVFVEPPQNELQTQQLQGRYGGIGVRIERDGSNNVYLYPIADSPAYKAGVRDGDRLFKVEMLEISADTNNDQLQAALRGPIGGKVKITVGHSPDYKPVELTIDRAETALPSTTWNIAPDEPRVGIVHVSVIADTTPDEVSKAIEELKQKGASRFVIDIRNNGGGLVEAGVKFAKLFLKSGIVIEEQYRGQPVNTYKVDKPGPYADLPMVVLVNQGTASSAEIFTGAIKGQKRALIVGTRTYGKDTIQLVFNLSDGSSLHVTAAHWWVPNLSPTIGGSGVQPDVPVDEKAEANQALQTAIQTVLK